MGACENATKACLPEQFERGVDPVAISDECNIHDHDIRRRGSGQPNSLVSAGHNPDHLKTSVQNCGFSRKRHEMIILDNENPAARDAGSAGPIVGGRIERRTSRTSPGRGDEA